MTDYYCFQEWFALPQKCPPRLESFDMYCSDSTTLISMLLGAIERLFVTLLLAISSSSAEEVGSESRSAASRWACVISSFSCAASYYEGVAFFALFPARANSFGFNVFLPVVVRSTSCTLQNTVGVAASPERHIHQSNKYDIMQRSNASFSFVKRRRRIEGTVSNGVLAGQALQRPIKGGTR